MGDMYYLSRAVWLSSLWSALEATKDTSYFHPHFLNSFSLLIFKVRAVGRKSQHSHRLTNTNISLTIRFRIQTLIGHSRPINSRSILSILLMRHLLQTFYLLLLALMLDIWGKFKAVYKSLLFFVVLKRKFQHT